VSRASRADLKGKVQTVTGLIDPADVGPALMHEHLFIDLNPPRFAAEAVDDDEITLCNCFKVRYGQQPSRLNYRLNERAIAAAEVAEMRAAGGRTIVELTSGGLRPDPGGSRSRARPASIS
jgi:phosphotriesterase-related protein